MKLGFGSKREREKETKRINHTRTSYLICRRNSAQESKKKGGTNYSVLFLEGGCCCATRCGCCSNIKKYRITVVLFVCGKKRFFLLSHLRYCSTENETDECKEREIQYRIKMCTQNRFKKKYAIGSSTYASVVVKSMSNKNVDRTQQNDNRYLSFYFANLTL